MKVLRMTKTPGRAAGRSLYNTRFRVRPVPHRAVRFLLSR